MDVSLQVLEKFIKVQSRHLSNFQIVTSLSTGVNFRELMCSPCLEVYQKRGMGWLGGSVHSFNSVLNVFMTTYFSSPEESTLKVLRLALQ